MHFHLAILLGIDRESNEARKQCDDNILHILVYFMFMSITGDRVKMTFTRLMYYISDNLL